MSSVTRLRPPVTRLVRVPAQIDGNVLIAELVRTLNAGDFTVSIQRDGSLLIHEIPRHLRLQGDSSHE